MADVLNQILFKDQRELNHKSKLELNLKHIAAIVNAAGGVCEYRSI